jgi:hypothetical protein
VVKRACTRATVQFLHRASAMLAISRLTNSGAPKYWTDSKDEQMIELEIFGGERMSKRQNESLSELTDDESIDEMRRRAFEKSSLEDLVFDLAWRALTDSADALSDSQEKFDAILVSNHFTPELDAMIDRIFEATQPRRCVCCGDVVVSVIVDKDGRHHPLN